MCDYAAVDRPILPQMSIWIIPSLGLFSIVLLETLKYMALGGHRATLHIDCILGRGVSGSHGVCMLSCLRTLPVSVNSGTSLYLDQCVRADLPGVLSTLFPVHFTLATLAGV